MPAQELVCREVSELLTALNVPHKIRSREVGGAVTVDIVLPDHQARARCSHSLHAATFALQHVCVQ